MSPSVSFRIVDFPVPEPPRTIFVSPGCTEKLMLSSITRSSYASTTSRNSMAGVFFEWPLVSLILLRCERSLENAQIPQCDDRFREKEIDRDDENRRRDDRLRRRAPDTDRAAVCAKPASTSNDRDDE